MKLGNILNNERVNTLNVDKNAYARAFNEKKDSTSKQINVQRAEKVLFPEAYENADRYYNKNEFYTSRQDFSNNQAQQSNQHFNNTQSMFDIKSMLPMLMSGKFNDLLKPLMSMFGGGGSAGGMDITKIFELFKPKSKNKKEQKEEDVSSKFDDFIIIED